jgi:general secretion pathway protein I
VLPGIGEADFSCDELGITYAGQLRTRATLNPNFRRVEAVVNDENGRVLVTLTTVLGRN